MYRRSGSPPAAYDVAVPDLLAESSLLPCRLLLVSLFETIVSARGQCKRDRRARQGGGHPRRVGGRPAALAELVAATGLPRATAHRLASPWRPMASWPRRRRALRPRAPATASSARRCPARPRGPAGRHRGERAALRPPGRHAGVRGVARVAPRPAHYRAPGFVAAARRRVGRPGVPRRRAARRRAWVESVEEREQGVASVSAPVRGRRRWWPRCRSSGPVERTTRPPGRPLLGGRGGGRPRGRGRLDPLNPLEEGGDEAVGAGHADAVDPLDLDDLGPGDGRGEPELAAADTTESVVGTPTTGGTSTSPIHPADEKRPIDQPACARTVAGSLRWIAGSTIH